MLERHHLLLLKTINEQGSVTKAAKSLFLTQSAVSHSMKKLETSLSTQLWQKIGRKVVLTQAGQILLQGAEKLLPQFEKLEEDILRLNKGEQGNIKIGIECYPCFQWLLKVIAPFLKKYPAIDVDVKNEFQFGGVGALLNFEIDLLLTPDPLYNLNLDYLPVFDYQLVLVVNSDDVLTQQPQVAPADIKDKVLFTFPVEQSRLDIFSQFLSPAGYSVKKHKTLENTEMMLEMVRHGRGVACLPDWLMQRSDLTGLTCLKIGDTGIHKTTYLATRKNASDDPILTHFLQQVLNHD